MSFRERYDLNNLANAQITANTGSQVLLAANVNRDWLFIQNTGAVTVHIAFGEVATTAIGIELPAGAVYENPASVSITQSVNVITAAGTTAMKAWEAD